jgi:DnaJ-class molecular chaperone
MATLTCPDCDSPGDGNCPVCHGKGKVPGDAVPVAFDVLAHESSCSMCRGSGECQTCGGMGDLEIGGEGG